MQSVVVEVDISQHTHNKQFFYVNRLLVIIVDITGATRFHFISYTHIQNESLFIILYLTLIFNHDGSSAIFLLIYRNICIIFFFLQTHETIDFDLISTSNK